MEDRSLVYRERDANDRRIIRIWLTEEGKQLMRVLPPIGAETLNKATQGMSETEQESVLKLLDQITQNLL